MAGSHNRRGKLGRQRPDDVTRPEHVNKGKRKGRKPGAVSRAHAEARRVAAATGVTPLEYMLGVMRDPEVGHPRRDAMAIAAAPYMHARLMGVKFTPADPNAVPVKRIERVIYDSHDGQLHAIAENAEEPKDITSEGTAEMPKEPPLIINREAAD